MVEAIKVTFLTAVVVLGFAVLVVSAAALGGAPAVGLLFGALILGATAWSLKQ